MKQILIPVLVFLLSACAARAPQPEPGFELVDYDRHSEFQAATGADWSGYSKVMLETATVEFRDNWVEDQRRHSDLKIREKDIERLKTGASDLFREVMSRELSQAGYTVVTDSGADVLLFKPRIVKLDIFAPDRVRDYIGVSLADSKGFMTVELDIHDSVSGELLATTSHYLSDPYDGYMERATTVSNRQAFRMMLMRWSDWLFEGLEKAGVSK